LKVSQLSFQYQGPLLAFWRVVGLGSAVGRLREPVSGRQCYKYCYSSRCRRQDLLERSWPKLVRHFEHEEVLEHLLLNWPVGFQN
jgi:hypothetical protein